MRRAAALVLTASVLAPASAGASTIRPQLALTATPARIALEAPGRRIVRVMNPGRNRIKVVVARAGFSLDLRGRPKVVTHAGRRAATSWLTVRPRRFVLRAGASRLLTVRSRLPRHVEPGDHDALVLLTTRPRRHGGVAVRMRLGIVVVVRTPGRVVHRLALGRLRIRRAHGMRILELMVVNRGNVTERLDRSRVRVAIRRGHRRTGLHAAARELRPRTRGIVQFRYRGRLHGWVTARVRITGEPGRRPVRRTFRVRL